MKTLNRLALFLHFFVGIGASAGGMGAILNPISPMGAPSSMLANSPFTDFLIPGIILFGLLGLGNLAAAALRLTRRPIANLIGGILGAALFIWIVVQCWMIRDIVTLHVIFAVIGVAQGLIALILLWRENQFPMNIARRYVGLRRFRT